MITTRAPDGANNDDKDNDNDPTCELQQSRLLPQCSALRWKLEELTTLPSAEKWDICLRENVKSYYFFHVSLDRVHVFSVVDLNDLKLLRINLELGKHLVWYIVCSLCICGEPAWPFCSTGNSSLRSPAPPWTGSAHPSQLELRTS